MEDCLQSDHNITILSVYLIYVFLAFFVCGSCIAKVPSNLNFRFTCGLILRKGCRKSCIDENMTEKVYSLFPVTEDQGVQYRQHLS